MLEVVLPEKTKEDLYQNFKKRFLEEIKIEGKNYNLDEIDVKLIDKSEEEKKLWRADKNDIYWYISSDNHVRYKVESIETHEDLHPNSWENRHDYSSSGKLTNANRILFGNYFKTKKQAEEAAEAVKEVLKQKREEFGLE